ncbi:uncharacterized protein [Primulina huaijiensis]|uniref:uncharacterized protein n=1 Tax=Primulina huaijiensis TaxID=1492673 RepID=UPI003CC71665
MHGGEVDGDGNCLFTAAWKSMGLDVAAHELRMRTVRRFLEDLGSVDEETKGSIQLAIRHMYSPDLKSGWGVHVLQEVKFLARKQDRAGMDLAIDELVQTGTQRCKHMDLMPWLTRKIVFSSFLIIQQVKSANLLSFCS